MAPLQIEGLLLHPERLPEHDLQHRGRLRQRDLGGAEERQPLRGHRDQQPLLRTMLYNLLPQKGKDLSRQIKKKLSGTKSKTYIVNCIEKG